MRRSDSWRVARRSGVIALLPLLLTVRAHAITGPALASPLPTSVVAVGSLPVACGAQFSTACSGVVIAPRLVISAAHCDNGLYASGRPQVLVPHADHDDEIIDISKISVPIPAVEDGTGGWDVALLTLDRATSAPVAQLGSMSLDANSLGKIAEVHGFGITDARTGTNQLPAAGTVSIASIGDQFIRFSPAPNMICDGDSGGALFVEEKQGLALAGVLSQADAACGVWGTATRLDTILRGVLSEAAAAELPPQRAAPEATNFERLCSTACTDDRDCPAGTHCTPLDGRPRALRSLGPPVGNYRASEMAPSTSRGRQLAHRTSYMGDVRHREASNPVAVLRSRSATSKPSCP